MYIHTSFQKINKLKNTNKQRKDFKPNGLWYSTNNNWNKYAIDNMYNQLHTYFYKLKIIHTTINKLDKNKILLIKTKKDYTNFIIEYGNELKIKNSQDVCFIIINWRRVAQNFGGIELKNLENLKKSHTFLLNHFNSNSKIKKNKIISPLNLFDIDSGCIWNIQTIKLFEEVFDFV